MKAAYTTTMGGNGFDPGVVPPGPLQPAIPETQRQQLPDPWMEHLVSLLGSPELNEEEQDELKLLIGQRAGQNERANAIFERVRTRSREKVTAEWELAKQAVRDQQAVLTAHHEKISELQRELNRANETKSLAFAARDAASEDKRRLSRYAKKGETEKANEQLVKREHAADLASKEAGTLQQQINLMTLTQLKPIAEELNRLMAEEAKLNHFVTGASYTNEFGLVVPARHPI